MNLETYRADIKTCLRRGTAEAGLDRDSQNLGAHAEILCPSPDWKGFRGIGDLLRHAYRRIDDEIIWDTVTLELPSLRAAVEKAFASL